MKSVYVSAAALNQIPLDWEGNSKRIARACSLARENNSKVLCLPELCLTGYGCEDAFHSPGVCEYALSHLEGLTSHTKGLFCCIGLPLFLGGAVFNAVAVLVDGQIVGFVPKQHLAGDGIHYEPRWFKPWQQGFVSSIEWDGKTYPVGDLIFDIEGIKIGFEICEDAWVGDRPGIALARRGVDIILNPSASHFAFGKHAIRERFVLEGARAFGVGYVYANLLGCEAGRAIYDGDVLIASQGAICARGNRFSFEEVLLTSASIDVNGNRINKSRQVSFVPNLNSRGDCVAIRGISIESSIVEICDNHPVPIWENSAHKKQEEFWRAVSLGLFDYMRKSLSQGFVVSLSGGVDSTAASCLVTLMVLASERELGLRGIKERLAYIPWMGEVKNSADIILRMLTCVYQGTENSSEETRTAAQKVAESLGSQFYDLNITPLVTAYEKLVEGATGVNLTWKQHDLAKQNIQARVRSPSVWLIANLQRALLLSTGNRSEAAVGYTTMDGDSSGGLSPLGGIDKAFLREWLTWLETKGPIDLQTSYPILRLVNQQQPTAELRPLEKKQTDEGDLMPYVVLDKIERYAVRDKKLPIEVFTRLRLDFNEIYKDDDLEKWTERFFTLWSMNQWKRERYAPSFHLDDENLDPKTWCRFPILSAGYKTEIEELRKFFKDPKKDRK